MDRLEEMMHMQYALQRRINGYNIDEQTIGKRVANIKENVLAATDELHELLGETSWKSWTVGDPYINWDPARKEAIDLWHFVMNLFLHLRMSPEQVYEMYMEKNRINHERQSEGYDGIKDKCPQCKRVLADVELREVIVQSPVPRVDIHCPCGRQVGYRPV